LIFFHVFDKKLEEELKLEDRPHKFVDLETGEQLKLNPLDIREQYASSSQKIREDLKVKCGKYGIEYVEADINKGFESILLPYLFKRSKLF
jgi:type IV secretory pathway VirB4 component